MSTEMNEIPVSNELAAKFKAAGISSLAVFLSHSHDQERVDAIGLDRADVHELNEALKKADVMLVLVPVAVAGVKPGELTGALAGAFGHVFDAARLCGAILAGITDEVIHAKDPV